jgi:hypothetical protein
LLLPFAAGGVSPLIPATLQQFVGIGKLRTARIIAAFFESNLLIEPASCFSLAAD